MSSDFNSFLSALYKKDTYTENGAISNSTTGSHLIDQFGTAGTFRGRSLSDVFADQSAIWGENKELALKFPFYLRAITRKVRFANGETTEKVIKGQGAKDESLTRLLWIAKYHPESFYKNLWILPLVGSWKDLWKLLVMDDSLDREKFYEVLKEGIASDSQIDLVKKYLPRIRSRKKCNTEWAKKSNEEAMKFCKYMGWTKAIYTKFKSTGQAHEFQRLITKGLYDNINFSLIPGRALSTMVKERGNKESFISRHNLMKKYMDWLEKQPVVKFTGYPYELADFVKGDGSMCKTLSAAEKMTKDKQFDGLIELAKKDTGKGITGNVWCALDTSSSMASRVNNSTDVTAYQVCVSLGVYFSTLNEGAFHDNVIMFDKTSHVRKLKGTFTDKIMQIVKADTAWGNTNFQSVIDEIVRIRKSNPNIPLEDYPETLLVVSDMQFDPSGNGNTQTNYETAMDKLRAYFPEEFVKNFKIVWWYVTARNGVKDFPSTMDDGGTYLFSGFDGAVINFLLGGEEKINPETGEKIQPTMEEIMVAALNQEILCQVTV